MTQLSSFGESQNICGFRKDKFKWQSRSFVLKDFRFTDIVFLGFIDLQQASDDFMSTEIQESRFWRDLGTLPNIISLSRIVLVAIAVILFVEGHVGEALVVGIIGGLTDYLDGYIARKTNTSTELGEVIDRLGDLFLEILAFILLVNLEIVPLYILMIYLFREIVVLSARQYASRKGGNLKSGIFGKVKTNCLGYCFALLLVHYAMINNLISVGFLENADLLSGMETLGFVGMYGGLVASYISGSQYMKGFISLYNKQGTA